ncbi:MAG: hypothetical protein ACI9IL_001023, partial [Rickettsiales bacterium]
MKNVISISPDVAKDLDPLPHLYKNNNGGVLLVLKKA